MYYVSLCVGLVGKTLRILQAEQDVTKKRTGFTPKALISSKDAGDTYISSLAPGDFNGDAQMDILVTRKKDGSGADSPVTVQVYWGSSLHNSLGKNTKSEEESN